MYVRQRRTTRPTDSALNINLGAMLPDLNAMAAIEMFPNKPTTRTITQQASGILAVGFMSLFEIN